MFWPKKNDWQTVAIDRGFFWKTTNMLSKETDSGQHNIRWLVCTKTGERDFTCDDKDEKLREYAMKKHDDVQEASIKWIHAGILKDGKHVTWVMPEYAPLGGLQAHIDALKADPEVKKILKEKMVDDALGAFEIAAKLHLSKMREKENK